MCQQVTNTKLLFPADDHPKYKTVLFSLYRRTGPLAPMIRITWFLNSMLIMEWLHLYLTTPAGRNLEQGKKK